MFYYRLHPRPPTFSAAWKYFSQKYFSQKEFIFPHKDYLKVFIKKLQAMNQVTYEMNRNIKNLWFEAKTYLKTNNGFNDGKNYNPIKHC